MNESLLLCFSIALFFASMTLLFLALFLSYQKRKLSIEETKLENEQLKIQSAEDTEKYKAILSCNTLDNTNSIFEQMILDCFNEYTIINILHDPNFKFKDETEMMITREVSNMVLDRISPDLILKLSLIYNATTAKSFSDILESKVHLHVFNFCLTNESRLTE